jgi:hypothetical protein
MNCPKCNTSQALMLLTSVLCTNQQCNNYDASHAADHKPKKKKSWPYMHRAKTRRFKPRFKRDEANKFKPLDYHKLAKPVNIDYHFEYKNKLSKNIDNKYKHFDHKYNKHFDWHQNRWSSFLFDMNKYLSKYHKLI